MSVADEIGAAIREARRDLRLNQEDLADLCGINRHYLGQLERGVETEYAQRAGAVLDALGLELVVRPRSDRLAEQQGPVPGTDRATDG